LTRPYYPAPKKTCPAVSPSPLEQFPVDDEPSRAPRSWLTSDPLLLLAACAALLCLSCIGVAGTSHSHADAGADSGLAFMPADSGITSEDDRSCSPPGTKGLCNTVLPGVCAAGSQICLSDDKWSSCEPEVTPGSRAEDCSNNEDDDCDGKTDAADSDCFECSPGTSETCTISTLKGVCAAGQRTCSQTGSWGNCQQQTFPGTESCGTTKDEDCDGAVGYMDTDCLTPVYRMYNASTGDHMNSVSSTEGSSVGYQCEGLFFQMLKGDVSGSKQALYRCRMGNGDHFTSVDPDCEGNIFEAQGGYVFTAQQPGTVPLYRCYHTTVMDHLTTKDPAECQKYNYGVEGILGYVS